MTTNIRVGPREKNPTHDVSFESRTEKWGALLQGGIRSLQESSISPSTLVLSSGGKRHGRGDPSFSSFEQDTWDGGRGYEFYDDDPSTFYDSLNAWTMTPGKLFPSLQWRWAEGLYYGDVQTPGAKRPAFAMGHDVSFVALRNTEKYMAMQFATQNNDYTMKTIGMWIRRVGNPAGNLTVAIFSDSAGEPGTSQETQTVTISTIDDKVSVFHEFELSTGVAQTHPETWWIVIYDDGSPTAAHHWEVGYGSGNSSQAKSSSDGSTWTNSSKQIFFRVTAAKVDRKWHFFYLEGGFYAVDEKASGAASDLYINGDRGIATSATATTIVDSTKSWTTDVWIGAWVKITAGTGKGQKRQITDSDGTSLTVATWDVTPDATSEYVIYATNEWSDITPAAGDQIDGVVKSVAIFDNIAIFAQGSSVNMLKMKWDSATPGHLFDDDGTNKGDLVHVFYDPVDGAQVWRAIGGSTMQISRASTAAWATDLTFGTGIPVGEKSYEFTGLIDYNDQLYVMKEDSIWSVKNDRATRNNVGLEAMPETTNGAAVAAQNLFLFFSWSHSMERLYSGTLDDLGPWQNAGLPDGRAGVISALEPIIAWMFAGIDAGSGTSSVLAWDGRGWHELFRAWKANHRVQNIKWQPCPGTRPRLWISIGGDVVYLEFPLNTLNPIKDSGCQFQHECVVESGAHLFQRAQLPKLYKQIIAISEGLGSTANMDIDYKVDDDIKSTDPSKWIPTTTLFHSPDDTALVNLGNTFMLRYRMILRTSDADVPPIVDAMNVEGFAREIAKREWTMRIKISSLQRTRRGAPDHDPRAFYRFLWNSSNSADSIMMHANDELMDSVYVVIQPPNLFRKFLLTLQGWLGGVVAVTVREA